MGFPTFRSIRTYRRTGDDFSATAPCTYVRFTFLKRRYMKNSDRQSLYWGRESRQVKSAKNLTVDRNSFTESRCSEQRTGITKKCASARFYEMPHGFVKSIPLTYEEGIDRRVFSGFEQNRFLHQTAKRMRRMVCWHRFFMI